MCTEKDVSQRAMERFGIVICPVHLVALTNQFDAKAVDPCAFKVIVNAPQGAIIDSFFPFEKEQRISLSLSSGNAIKERTESLNLSSALYFPANPWE